MPAYVRVNGKACFQSDLRTQQEEMSYTCDWNERYCRACAAVEKGRGPNAECVFVVIRLIYAGASLYVVRLSVLDLSIEPGIPWRSCFYSMSNARRARQSLPFFRMYSHEFMTFTTAYLPTFGYPRGPTLEPETFLLEGGEVANNTTGREGAQGGTR